MPNNGNFLQSTPLSRVEREIADKKSESIAGQRIDNGKISDISDEELARLSLENRDYFGHLIKRYEQKLTKYIIRISGLSVEDSEDILQEVFIKTYRNLNDLDRSLKFSSWIYRIAHNQTISHYRKAKVRPDFQAVGLDEQIANNLSADSDLNLHLDREQSNRMTVEILDSLEEKYREVLVLKFFEEKSYEEIADIIKKPMGTVATLISRAKNKFKKAAQGKKYDRQH